MNRMVKWTILICLEICRDYKTVPAMRSDDKVLPPASEIPAMLSSIRRRQRTISIGPQSEADAREHIAKRQELRRQGSASNLSRSRSPNRDLRATIDEHAVLPTPDEPPAAQSYLSVQSSQTGVSNSSSRANLPADILTPPASDGGLSSDEGREDEKADQKLFASVEKPRIRYDVEVITKLVVYAGNADRFSRLAVLC